MKFLPQKSFSNYLIVSLVAAFSISGCTALKDMGEMKDTTKHMDQTTTHMDQITTGMSDKTDHLALVTETMGTKTDHMSQVTDHLSDITEKMGKKTDHMADVTDEMVSLTKGMDQKMDVSNANMIRMIELSNFIYTDGRQSAAAEDRRNFLMAMVLAKTLVDKVQSAVLYFDAFEFQVWKGTGTDTDAKREALEANAVDQFFRQTRAFLKDYEDYSPLTLRDQTKDLMALSAAMGEKNPNQPDAAAAKNFTSLSFEDILEQGLAKRPDISDGNLKTWSPQVNSVLQNEKAAVYLLNLRHNFLVGCALAKIAEVDVDNLVHSDQIFNLLKKGASIIGGNPIDIAYQNIPQMDEEIQYLGEALRVRTVLYNLNYPIARSHLVARGTQVVSVKADVSKLQGAVQAEKDQKLARVQTINKLLSKLNEVKSPNEKIYNVIQDLGLNP